MIDDWHDAAAKADETRYFDHLAAGAVFMGTDASERWEKAAFLAYAHPHFAKGKAWSFHAARRVVVIDSAELAHFDEDLVTEKLGPARGSGIVALRDGAWKILHYNLAVTVPNDRFGGVRAAIDGVLLGPEPGKLSALSWLSGAWVTEPASGAPAGSERTIEVWSPPDGGSMVGMSRTTKGGTTTFFESMRIEARGEKTVLVALPKGQAQAEFVLAEGASSSTSAVFENPKHDFPKTITYRREGEVLIATIEGGGPASQWKYRRAVLAP